MKYKTNEIKKRNEMKRTNEIKKMNEKYIERYKNIKS